MGDASGTILQMVAKSFIPNTAASIVEEVLCYAAILPEIFLSKFRNTRTYIEVELYIYIVFCAAKYKEGIHLKIIKAKTFLNKHTYKNCLTLLKSFKAIHIQIISFLVNYC